MEKVGLLLMRPISLGAIVSPLSFSFSRAHILVRLSKILTLLGHLLREFLQILILKLPFGL